MSYEPDKRYSDEFYRRVGVYLGGMPDHVDPAYRVAHERYWRDHVGYRAEWLKNCFLWRLEYNRPLAGLKVLDFGCGTGSSSVVLAEAGAFVVGVDTDQISLDVAVQRGIDLNLINRIDFHLIPFLTGKDERLNFEDESFDVITLIGVLEHMKDIERLHCVREIRRLIKKGGEVFIFDTPNRLFPYDHHTTNLWFVGWMPESIARRYAVWRRRLKKGEDFRRKGSAGISRLTIERLFSPHEWEMVYDKDPKEILSELAYQGQNNYFLKFILMLSAKCTQALNKKLSILTHSHAICFKKC